MKPKDVGALLLLSALWGGSFIFIHIAALVLGPVVLIELRVLLAGIALLCTTVAYLIYFYLIETVGPTRAITVTFLSPIFGVLWGILFLGESLTVSTLLGFSIILVGTGCVTGVLRFRTKHIHHLNRECDML